ncbi:hypothetical protein [Tumebacillus flagellatus]|uniref:Uncharacterized protein n=1 Tax=Tumebacillus flagellatus TaxID=1157490 RepID=A0A074LXE4_9BACL|nr:hypothetical protein [Tumebacillus flagellatus]KEO84773.1 hypothetical protein EL26_01820 [Tumebacillus flagellatus]
MKIVELDWAVENIEKLTPEERQLLDELDVVSQKKSGELKLSANNMLKLLAHCGSLYEKYR